MRYATENKGSAVILALFTLGVLTAVVATSMQRTNVDTNLAGTWTKRSKSFQVAESSLQIVARKIADEYEAMKSLDGVDDIYFGTTSGGQYSVIIEPYGEVDMGLHLIATGAIGPMEQVVDAYYEMVTQAVDRPGSEGIGALGICGTDATISHAMNIKGSDYDIPNYPCAGAGCNGVASANPDRAGLSYNAGTSVHITSGAPTGNPAVNNNAGIDCTAWNSFIDAAAAIATTTYNAANGPFNAATEATSFGTGADPKIIVIEGSPAQTAQFNGNLYGNGILIIRNTNVKFNGTFTFAGLIIIEDNGGSLQFGGTAQVFGSTMVVDSNDPDAQTEITWKNKTSPIHYSTEGMAQAQEALDNAGGGAGSLRLIAWRTLSN